MRRSTAKPPPPPPTAPPTAFTLQGRVAPGLYTLGWLGSVVGLVLFFIALQTDAPVRGFLLMGSLLILLGGLSSAAGYQIVERRQRPPRYFMGASPLLIFAIQFVLVQIVTVMLVALGVFGQDVTPTFLFIAAIVQVVGYVFVVWAFGIRSGAFDWAGLGLPRMSFGRLASDLAVGAGVMLLVGILDSLWGAFLSTVLGSGPPQIVPPPSTATETLMIIIAVCVLVPIGEELLYRGYNLSAWWRDLGARSAILRSGLFFGLVHVLNVNVDPNVQDAALAGVKQATIEFLVIAPVGLALGWLFVRRGLVSTIAGHAAFNFLGVLGLLLTSGFLRPVFHGI